MNHNVGDLIIYSQDIGQFFKKIPAIIIKKLNLGYVLLICESFDVVICMPYLIQKL